MERETAGFWCILRLKCSVLLRCLVIIMLTAMSASAAAMPLNATVSPFSLVFGEKVQSNFGVLVNGHIYLPLRQIGELFGIQVDFSNDMVLVEGQAQPNASGTNLTTLAPGYYEAQPSPFPLVVRGYQITPNPGILIQNQAYLPLRRLSEILGVEIDFKNETVYLGEATGASTSTIYTIEDQALPFAPAIASATFDAPLVSKLSWSEGGEYEIDSLEEFQELLELMISELGRSAILHVADVNIATACHMYIRNYNLERVQGITLDINHSGGSILLSYTPTQEVAIAYQRSDLHLSRQAQQLGEVVEQVLRTEIRSEMTAYDKEKAIHDFLIRHVEYDLEAVGRTEATSSSTAYGALVMRKAVCSGYAEAFKLFMDLLDIECHIVVGRAGNVDHAWNLVHIDGANYHVDSTWDDPVTYDENGNRVANIEPRYGFFNLTDQLLAFDHTWDRNATPPANGTIHRYLRFDETQEMLMQGIEEALRRGDNTYASRCLFLSNATTNITNFAQHILEVAGSKYGYSSITLSSDNHGTIMVEFTHLGGR